MFRLESCHHQAMYIRCIKHSFVEKTLIIIKMRGMYVETACTWYTESVQYNITCYFLIDMKSVFFTLRTRV
jgi:hypothetical protein